MNYRGILIRIFTFLGGIYFFLEYVLPDRIGEFQFGLYHDEISRGFQTIGAMALGLGVINLLLVHGSKVVFRKKDSLNSAALLLGMLAMVTVVSLDWNTTHDITARADRFSHLRDFSDRIRSDFEAGTAGVPPFYERNQRLSEALGERLQWARTEVEGFVLNGSYSLEEVERLGNERRRVLEITALCDTINNRLPRTSDAAPVFEANEALAACLADLRVAYGDFWNLVYSGTTIRGIYRIFFDGLFTALGSAMFSLLGFYIASAAYRAFRIQSMESLLMMAAALFVMLGQIPFGLWIGEWLPEFRNWLLFGPSTAAYRAIKIGAAVAGLIMAFRMWFSIESESFVEDRVDGSAEGGR